MKPIQQARWMAYARIGFGAAFAFAPAIVLRPWVGRDAGSPAVKLVARSLAAREVAIGMGTLMADRHGGPVRGWVEAGVVSDAGDALATLVAFRHLPKLGAAGAVVAATGAAVAGRRIVSGLGSVRPATG